MPEYSTDRRSLLKIIGAVGTTCAYPFASEDLFGQTHGSHAPAVNAARYFNEVDYATVSRIADLIVPQTDTPGAVTAGVPAFIDAVIGRNDQQQRLAADGLRWLDAEAKRMDRDSFIDLTESQQLSILEPLCEAYDADHHALARNVQFFGLIKSLTADGYYTSEEGLLQELQYKGSARNGYPSCEK
jgi:gluconate 2-dehydrogenase gamma chain